MGCVCGKATFSVTDSDDCSKQRELMRKTSELQAARAISLKKEQIHTLKQKSGNGDIRVVQMDKKVNRSGRDSDDHSYKGKESNEVVTIYPGMGRIPKPVQGEQVAAGWPSWLVAVAGEAIKGWIPRRADTFEKFDKIGQGTYSSVYKGRDLLSNKVVALKKVRFDNMDPESVKFMAREILILRRLDHPNIIKLEGLVASKTSSSLYLVFEYMEHDLTGLASIPGVKFTEPQVKCYMKQLLSGLDYCHSNGVLHRDIKGSNLLIDNHGMLKIADFGLASYFDYTKPNSNSLTSRVVTLWYRPPELLLGATQYGVAVDLWSTGCILGELYTGKPIMPGRTEVEQLHKIFKLCGSPSEEYWRKSKLRNSTVFKPVMPYKRRVAETFKELPDVAVRLMETLLSIDPLDRGTANSALESEFFNTNPLPCDPSSLPKYPPSKEMDAKMRNEEKRRQRVNGNTVQMIEKQDLKRSKECPPAQKPDSNAELARLMQEHGQSEQKAQSAYFNTRNDKTHSGFPVLPLQDLNEKRNDHHQQNPPHQFSYSGPLASKAAKCNDKTSDRNDLLRVHSRAVEPEDKLDYSGPNQFPESFGKPMRHHERRHHTRIFPGSHQIENGRPNIKDNDTKQHGHKEKNIHFSGPLVHSNNIDNVLKEHERRIQETARRLKQEKSRGGKIRPNEAYLPSNLMYISGPRGR